MKRRVLADDFHVCLCATISGPVPVVQDQELENESFVVSNKDDWLVKFHKKLEVGDKTGRNDKTDDGSRECVDQEEESDAHNEEGIGEVLLQIH